MNSTTCTLKLAFHSLSTKVLSLKDNNTLFKASQTPLLRNKASSLFASPSSVMQFHQCIQNLSNNSCSSSLSILQQGQKRFAYFLIDSALAQNRFLKYPNSIFLNFRQCCSLIITFSIFRRFHSNKEEDLLQILLIDAFHKNRMDLKNGPMEKNQQQAMPSVSSRFQLFCKLQTMFQTLHRISLPGKLLQRLSNSCWK